MAKRKRITYWISTIWLALGMVSAGIVQIMLLDEEVEMITHLGYPTYFAIILGIWKILGVIVILLPKLPLVKEWAYAGFFFTLTGAVLSHIKLLDSFTEIAPALFLLALTIVSWYFRPENRRLI